MIIMLRLIDRKSFSRFFQWNNRLAGSYRFLRYLSMTYCSFTWFYQILHCIPYLILVHVSTLEWVLSWMSYLKHIELAITSGEDSKLRQGDQWEAFINRHLPGLSRFEFQYIGIISYSILDLMSIMICANNRYTSTLNIEVLELDPASNTFKSLFEWYDLNMFMISVCVYLFKSFS